MADLEKIGDRFREVREENGIKQGKLALALNIMPNTLSRIETGKNKDVPTDILIDFANHFGVYTDWLLTGEGQKYRMTDELYKEAMEEANDLIKSKSKEELVVEIQLREKKMQELKESMRDLIDKT